MDGWQKLLALGALVFLPVPALTATGRAVPIPSLVYQVAGGLAAQSQEIVGVLEAMGDRYPGVLVGSYPKFHVDGATVEVVVKSSDPAALEAAVVWIEAALEEATR